MAGYTATSSPLTDSGEAEMLHAGYVTANYFELLGVKPTLGRAIASGDKENDVVVLSAELWIAALAATPIFSGASFVWEAL